MPGKSLAWFGKRACPKPFLLQFVLSFHASPQLVTKVLGRVGHEELPRHHFAARRLSRSGFRTVFLAISGNHLLTSSPAVCLASSSNHILAPSPAVCICLASSSNHLHTLSPARLAADFQRYASKVVGAGLPEQFLIILFETGTCGR